MAANGVIRPSLLFFCLRSFLANASALRVAVAVRLIREVCFSSYALNVCMNDLLGGSNRRRAFPLHPTRHQCFALCVFIIVSVGGKKEALFAYLICCIIQCVCVCWVSASVRVPGLWINVLTCDGPLFAFFSHDICDACARVVCMCCASLLVFEFGY